MAIEIEVKILDIDRLKVESTLISLGAKKTFDGEVHAVYYSRGENHLRVRKVGAKAYITHKTKLESNGAKVREELEVEVSDFTITLGIFKKLGYTIVEEAFKQRTSYTLGTCHVEFDAYTGEYDSIPEFLEIEGPSIEEIHAFASKLGFSKEDCKNWGWNTIVEHYK